MGENPQTTGTTPPANTPAGTTTPGTGTPAVEKPYDPHGLSVAPYTEAPASVNYFLVEEQGGDLQMTSRGADEITILEHIFTKVLPFAKTHGWRLRRYGKAGGTGGAAESAGAPPGKTTAPPSGAAGMPPPTTTGTPPPTSAGTPPPSGAGTPPAGSGGTPPTSAATGGTTGAGQQGPTITFVAEKIVPHIASSGKTYWRVKGGKYVKAGVMIWSDGLLTAGFVAEKMEEVLRNELKTNPGASQTLWFNVSGYTAVCSVKADKPDQPDVVIRLIPPQAK